MADDVAGTSSQSAPRAMEFLAGTRRSDRPAAAFAVPRFGLEDYPPVGSTAVPHQPGRHYVPAAVSSAYFGAYHHTGEADRLWTPATIAAVSTFLRHFRGGGRYAAPLPVCHADLRPMALPT